MIAISPSTLSFLYNECRRCFWKHYRLGLRRPNIFPRILNKYHKIAENKTANRATQGLIDLPEPGFFIKNEFKVLSEQVDGLYIKGRLDTLIKFADGKYAVCDFKTGPDPNDHSDFYLHQLDAYCFALENPANGNGIKIKHNILSSLWPDDDGNLIIPFNSKIFEPNPGRIVSILEDVSNLLNSEIPSKSEKCGYCNYVEKSDL